MGERAIEREFIIIIISITAYIYFYRMSYCVFIYSFLLFSRKPERSGGAYRCGTKERERERTRESQKTEEESERETAIENEKERE